jgi:cytochrome c oxidase cbb3-type subunit 2
VKNGALLFLGLFAALGFSWAGIVLGSHRQLGNLAPYYDAGSSQSFPNGFPGVAAQGNLVYRDLNCASCHTQQVRREGFGSDEARGWGTRESVARDYIYQPYPQIGQSRNGPDLANLATRKPKAPDAARLYQLLYAGRGGMPAYAFLFETRKISGQAAEQALVLSGSAAPAAGYEVVPTKRAEALVSYLLSLSTPYDYPEAKLPAAEGKPAAAPAAKPAATVAKPAAPAKPTEAKS